MLLVWAVGGGGGGLLAGREEEGKREGCGDSVRGECSGRGHTVVLLVMVVVWWRRELVEGAEGGKATGAKIVDSAGREHYFNSAERGSQPESINQWVVCHSVGLAEAGNRERNSIWGRDGGGGELALIG